MGPLLEGHTVDSAGYLVWQQDQAYQPGTASHRQAFKNAPVKNIMPRLRDNMSWSRDQVSQFMVGNPWRANQRAATRNAVKSWSFTQSRSTSVTGNSKTRHNYVPLLIMLKKNLKLKALLFRYLKFAENDEGFYDKASIITDPSSPESLEEF